MEIRKCGRGEYAEFLDTCNNVFNYGAESEWFQKNLSNCTPYPDKAADGEIACHFLCYIDGALAGGLGVYPLDWTVADGGGRQATIPAYGVGQVCCKPEFRNSGVMSCLLKTSAEEMRVQGRIVGFLSGKRFRYMHFGYDFGGSRITYNINKRRLEEASGGFNMREAVLADWPELNTAYDKLPSRILRNGRAWEKHFMRENYRWYIAELNGKKAYAAVRDGVNVNEIYGDAQTAEALIAKLFVELNKDEIDVGYFLNTGVTDEMERMLYDRAEYLRLEILSQIAIFDAPGLLRLLEGAGIDTGMYGAGEKELQARRLLRHAHQPLKEGVGDVTPLLAWIPDADNI